MLRKSFSQTVAGKYDRRILIQIKTETQSRSGAVTEDWETETPLNVAAAFEALGSREFPIDQKRHSETTARFRIRYRPDIDPDSNRISYAGQTWNIYPPLTIGRNVELVIEASEVQ